jgi:hypothetical protein
MAEQNQMRRESNLRWYNDAASNPRLSSSMRQSAQAWLRNVDGQEDRRRRDAANAARAIAQQEAERQRAAEEAAVRQRAAEEAAARRAAEEAAAEEAAARQRAANEAAARRAAEEAAARQRAAEEAAARRAAEEAAERNRTRGLTPDALSPGGTPYDVSLHYLGACSASFSEDRVLGKPGAFGTVYRSVDQTLGLRFAVKRLS